MNGEASWITAAVLLFGGLAVVLLAVVSSRIGTTLRAIPNHGYCPGLGRQVDRLILVDRFDGHWANVAKCAAFEDPEHVTCAKACLKQGELGAVLKV